ncbi:MAG: pyridoxal phosphate-dependent aminotransferase [Lentisphaerae bacterium]|nr:pyridoxal phosphate-dependent aminotransferase [Lentisphaerota bacterium]
MRAKISNLNAGLMRYGIREMVELTQQIAARDPQFKFIGENIGDPLEKGWEVPRFLRELLHAVVDGDQKRAFGYTHSRGDLAARIWVAENARRQAPASRLDPEHVLFANGLGGAISILYRCMGQGARILQPNPGYPAHISSESFFAGAASLGYHLDPASNWEPDLDHIEAQLRSHPEIAGILLINPNNPTGTVCRKPVLESLVDLAERHGLLLISDEVYFRLVYNGGRHVHLAELAAGRAPLVVMRGVSKDVPWPGSRCGWMEFHNLDLDDEYRRFFEVVKRPLMLEVCATTMPQAVVPQIYSHPEYPVWLEKYTRELEANANSVYDLLAAVRGLNVTRIQGAFYMLSSFDQGALNGRQSLPVKNPEARAYLEGLLALPGVPPDKRFAYYLLAATGICVVPASDFDSPYPGFRITTLDRDPRRRDATYRILAQSVTDYLASA